MICKQPPTSVFQIGPRAAQNTSKHVSRQLEKEVTFVQTGNDWIAITGLSDRSEWDVDIGIQPFCNKLTV